MKAYHGHIYFSSDDYEKAQDLYNKALLNTHFTYCKINPLPIGPHPLGMIEVHFKESSLDACREWLQIHRNSLSILIHIDTGNDLIDHTENIEWLGSPVKIDFSFFELIKDNPKLKVHQD